MLSPDQRRSLAGPFSVTRIIWLMMLGSLGVYIGVCHVLEGQLRGVAGIGEAFPVLRGVLFIVSLLTIVTIRLVRSKLIKAMVSQKRNKDVSSSELKVIGLKYQSAVTVSLAMAESIGIYGLVLFLIGGDFGILYLFNAMSAAAMFVFRPQMSELENILTRGVKREQIPHD